MTRVKRGKIATKKRAKLLKQAKGFYAGRKNKERAARETLLHAWSRATTGRKLKKRETRKAWQVNISAATKQENLSYSKTINLLKKNKIELDRKILAEIAQKHPEVFKKILQAVSK